MDQNRVIKIGKLLYDILECFPRELILLTANYVGNFQGARIGHWDCDKINSNSNQLYKKPKIIGVMADKEHIYVGYTDGFKIFSLDGELYINDFGQLKDSTSFVTYKSKLYILSEDSKVSVYDIPSGKYNNYFIPPFGSFGITCYKNHLYITSRAVRAIYVYTLDGKRVKTIEIEFSIFYHSVISFPRSFAVVDDQIYIIDLISNSVVVLTLDGKYLSSWYDNNGNPYFRAAQCICVFDDNIYIGDDKNILMFTKEGTLMKRLEISTCTAGICFNDDICYIATDIYNQILLYD